MAFTRTWIFPVLRIIIFIAIAAALVKIAFFADPASSETDGAGLPTGEIVEPEVPATIGTIQNDVTVTATVSADPAVAVKATLGGDVLRLLVAEGAAVAADTPVMTLRSTTPGTVNAEGVQGPDVVRTVTVTAGTAGIVSDIPVIAEQAVSVGDTVAQVAPTTFNVSGSLAPEQQYRLLTMPTEAQVTITGGPAPFTCGSVTITTALAGASDDSGLGLGGADGSTTGATVKCLVPPEVTVFSGLAATMTLAGGIAENVLTVPVTAVEGLAGTGNVYSVAEDGTPTSKPVTLGLNDGINVEVREGLTEGEMVLQFVPGAQQTGGIDTGDGCTSFPDGTVTCDGLGG